MKVYYEETRDISSGKYLDFYVEAETEKEKHYQFHRFRIPTNKKFDPKKVYLKAANIKFPLLLTRINKDLNNYFEI